jgi:glycosyltransferase involved in cell wall biosynthesis
MDKIQLTVIIPNYNYANHLEQCLKSVFDSDFDTDKMEIIFVDDASTDDSLNVVERMKSKSRFPFCLIKNETNLGLILSRNRGIAYARGEFLFFLDSDNYIRKDCIKTHVAAMQQNPEADACFAPIQDFLDKTGEYCGLRSCSPFDSQKLLEGPYIDAMAMFRKKILEETGMYDNKMPHYGWEDYELWLRLGKAGRKVIFIQGEPRSFYRVHQLNKSQNYTPDQHNHLVYYLKQNYPVKLDLYPSETLDSLINQKKHIAQLYYQSNNAGFNEQNSIVKFLEDNPFHFKLPSGNAFLQLRFDPVDDFAVVKLNHIRFFDVDGEILINTKITSNADEIENATHYFFNPDPRILIEFEEALTISEVVVEVEYLKSGTVVFEDFEKINKPKSEKTINLTKKNENHKDQLAQKASEFKKTGDDLNEKIQPYQNEIRRLHKQNGAMADELASIKSSFFYKLAKIISLVHPGHFSRWVKEKTRFNKNIRLIRKSKLFDVGYYLQSNPDVRDSGMDAVRHFLIYGGAEGRNPSADFDSSQYLETYPDVKISGLNPLLHYIVYGKKEGRLSIKTSPAATIKNVAIPGNLKSFILENNGNTEFINNFFDRIYVINLRRRQDRLEKIIQKLKRLNISAEIIEAVDGYIAPHIDEYEVYKNISLGLDNTSPEEIKLKQKLIYSPGVWGHLKSNRLILNDAIEKGYQKILILEDDVLFIKNFHHEFENFTRVIAGKNWKFLYLGATQACWDIPECIVYPDKSLKTYQPGQPYYHPVSTVGSFALAIDRSQFKGIIEKIDNMNCPFDWIYHRSFNQFSDQSFVAQPNLIVADFAESDNRVNNIPDTQKLLVITRRKWDLTKYD